MRGVTAIWFRLPASFCDGLLGREADSFAEAGRGRTARSSASAERDGMGPFRRGFATVVSVPFSRDHLAMNLAMNLNQWNSLQRGQRPPSDLADLSLLK